MLTWTFKSCLRDPAGRLVVAAALLVLGWIGALACSSNFSNTILGSDDDVLHAPVADFYVELNRLKPLRPVEFKVMVPLTNQSAFQQSAAAEAADLREVLKRSTTTRVRAQLVGEYTALQEKLAAFKQRRFEWQRARIERSWDVKAEKEPPPAAPTITLPEGLPAEFAHYARGAVAWAAGQTNDARAAWLAVLALPEGERRFRSTWAAYMVGRSYVDDEPAKAVEQMEAVRRLARQGFADSLGLAAASYGWQGRAELKQGNLAAAFELYLQQHAAGDASAAMSLRLTAERAFKEGTNTLQRLATNASARPVLTAYIIARGGPAVSSPTEPGEDLVRVWLDAVEAANVNSLDGADRLAWAAYQAGQMTEAEKWVARSAPDAPIALWIKSKLLLRAGKLDQAAATLAKAIGRTDPKETWAMSNNEVRGGDAPFQRMNGELAVLKLVRRQFTDALATLLQAGYEEDAVYLADRILTVEELTAFLKQPREDVPAEKLHIVLAQRLSRVGRWEEARPWFAATEQKLADDYLRTLTTGRDESLPPAERAAALWRAARLMRKDGYALLGAPIDVEWKVSGVWHFTAALPGRITTTNLVLLPVSAEERRRAEATSPFPNRAWYYRFAAAMLGWEAAKLMPNNSDETARVLCEAGTWIKYLDPQAADFFYKALVRRCRKTALGQEADRRRWFPPLPAAAQE